MGLSSTRHSSEDEGPKHMTGISGNPDATHSREAECSECEARLHHVLAFICEKRHRRWFAAAAFFLLIYQVSSIPFDTLNNLVFDALELAGFGPSDLFGPGVLGLVLLTTTFLPPFIITLIICSRLRRAYRGH